ncbi:MAG: putative glycoside hydrolase [Bacillota bacterium]|nr:putative glycoside hydrolase [Bacillota bacterium]
MPSGGSPIARVQSLLPTAPGRRARPADWSWLGPVLVVAVFALLTWYQAAALTPDPDRMPLEHWRYVRWALADLEAQGWTPDAETPAGLPEDPVQLRPGGGMLAAPLPLWPALEAPGAFTRLVEGSPGGPRNDIRAIYLTGSSAGNQAFMERVFKLAETSQINAVVIDVKDNSGRTTYPSQIPAVLAANASGGPIRDLAALFVECEKRGIYTIGRLVVFADPALGAARPELAIHSLAGGLWRDQTRHGWTNPYSREVWEYNLAIAAEVAALGCREIQFDYVRFPSDGRMDLVYYPVRTDEKRPEVIEGFLRRAREALAPYGVFTAADVFGLVTSFTVDMNIGQLLENVARQVDFVCPMMYPSHYAPGNYGIPDPDAEPYLTIRTGLLHALARLDGYETIIRPWLQDFSWRHKYGVNEVKAQIRAAGELGVGGFMLWNPRNVYTEAAVK